MKLEENYSEMHPKTVQKHHLLSTGTIPGTARHGTVRYRQEYFDTIHFFPKKHKIKKTDVYGTNVTYGNSNL